MNLLTMVGSSFFFFGDAFGVAFELDPAGGAAEDSVLPQEPMWSATVPRERLSESDATVAKDPCCCGSNVLNGGRFGIRPAQPKKRYL